MKLILIAGCALAAAVALTGCMSLGQPKSGDGKQESWAAAAVEIAKDPNCGHTDEVDIMLGVISQGHVKLARNCPVPTAKTAPAAPPAAPAAAPPLATGDVVIPPSAPTPA
jgi:hypothetical protein